MEIKLDDVIGIKSLYKGRTTQVRMRMHEFIQQTLQGLTFAYINRSSYKFQWQSHTFNQGQREAIIKFFEWNNLIEAYSKGFSFGEDTFKQTELYPSRNLFDSITVIQNPDVRTIIRSDKTILTKTDNDAKILAKYSKRLESALNVPLVDFKRIYTNNSEHGGRIYSTYQGMSAVDRLELIRINGNKVTELDYRNNHLNILLTTFGRPLHRDHDLYSIMDDYYLDRKDVKRAVSAILNSERPISTLTSVHGSFQWESSLANLFLNRFYEHFPELKNLRKGSALGLSLQKFEGDVMMDIIERLIPTKTIVLPVHDSLICSEGDRFVISEMMNSVWLEHIQQNKNKFTGFLK